MPATNERLKVSDRKGYLGGSDAGAILGLSPFASPLQVFAEKVGLDNPRRFDPATLQHFYFGHAMEEIIGKAVAERLNIPVKRERRFWRAARHSFMGGHLDWMVKDESAFLECKNIQYMSNEWEPPHDSLDLDASNKVPKYYLAQCDHYLYVTDFDYCYLAALVGGCELKMYRIYRDAGREKILLHAEKNFWERVLSDQPPLGMDYDDFVLSLQLGYTKSLKSKEAKKIDPIQIDDETVKLLHELGSMRATATKLNKSAREMSGELLKRINFQLGYLCNIHGDIVGSVLSQSRASFDDFALQMEYPEIHAKFARKTTFPVVRVKDGEEAE